LKQQPANPELYLHRAELHRQHSEFGMALADLTTAARLKPDWSTLLLVRAKTLFDARLVKESARRGGTIPMKWTPTLSAALVHSVSRMILL